MNFTSTPPSNSLIFIFLLIFGIVTNFWLRLPLDPIFDETIKIQFLQRQITQFNVTSPDEYFQKFWNEIWYEPPTGIPQRPLQTIYRPLLVLHILFNVLYFHIFGHVSWIPILINCFLLSATAGSIFLVSQKLTNNRFCSIGAAILTMFSIPALTGTWIVVTGAHCLVSLAMSLALLSYINYKETNSLKWLTPLSFILFLGPLYKEYFTLMPFILLCAEIFSYNRSVRLICFILPFLFHALYPAFLINLIFYHNLVFRSPLANYYNYIISFSDVQIKWHFTNILIFSIPPLLSLLGALGIYKISENNRTENNFQKMKKMLVFVLLYGSLFVSRYDALQPWAGYLSFSFLILISFFAFRIHFLLAIWFLISWLPYLITYYVEVHLVHAIGPMTIIFLWYAEKLFRGSIPNKPSLRGIQLFSIIVIIAFLDQGLNLIAVQRVFKETAAISKNIAQYMIQNREEKSFNILLSHSLLGKDIGFYFERDVNRPLDMNGFTVIRDPIETEELYISPMKFLGLLENFKLKANIYLLDVNFYPTQMAWFIKSIPYISEVVYLYKTDVVYLYTDILKFFVPSEYLSFPGSPDLRDFARMETHLFYRRLSGEQILYKLR